MLKTLSLDNNEVGIKCKDLTCENLPTFAGTVLPSISNIVERNAVDILSGERIIVGDGTNKIKDSNIDATSDNINLPLDKGYWINSQPIVYQDNADSSKYKIEVHTAKLNNPSNQLTITPGGAGFNIALNATNPAANRVYSLPDSGADANFVLTEGDQTINGAKVLSGTGNITMNTGAVLETNDIVSKTGSDITIDAVGDQRINFGTLSNFGTRFTTTASNNWAAEFRNNTGNYMVVEGTFETSGDHRPQIGGHQISPLAWDVLWLNPVNLGTAFVCIGDQTRANVIAKGDKLYVEGSAYSSGPLLSGSSLTVRQNGANGHILTSAVAPSAAYNHFLQPKTGTLCDVDQRIINMGLTSDFTTASGSYVRVTNFLFGGTNNLGDFMTNLFVAYSASGGFLVSIRLQDVTNSLTIAESARFASGGSNQILTLSSFSNIPATPAIFELQCSTSTAPNITVHGASLQL